MWACEGGTSVNVKLQAAFWFTSLHPSVTRLPVCNNGQLLQKCVKVVIC